MKNSLLLFMLFIPICLNAQVYEEIFKAVAADREIDDRAGHAVDVYGDYAVIGAYGDDLSIENEGSAYVYYRTGVSTWNFLQKLTASDQEGYDRFGWSVAIHEDYIVIGAYAEDDDVSGGSSMSKAGSAYIFEKDVSGMFVEVQKIVASDRAIDDEFGWSVDIFENTIVVGAHTEDHNASGGGYIFNAGSVYMFERDGGGVWNQTQKIVGSERSADIVYPGGYSGEDLSDLFGGCVALSGDYLIVGSHMNDYGPGYSSSAWNAGAAYIFEKDAGGVWVEAARLNNPDRAAWDRFGYDVAIDDTIAIVCARAEDEGPDFVSDFVTNTGSVYIFHRDGGSWTFQQKIVAGDRDAGDHFGSSLELHGNYMVLGTHSDNEDELGGDEIDNAGAAYVFERDGSGFWTQYQKIVASDRDLDDEFGFAASINGNTVLVGAPFNQFDESGGSPVDEAGAGYFYSTDVCSPSFLTQDLTICSGTSVTVGSSVYSSSGSYTDVILKSDGCDSTVTTNLTVNLPVEYPESITICSGISYSIGSSTYTESGTFNDTLTAIDGCDSLVITSLTVDTPPSYFQTINQCSGTTYSIGSSTYSTSGIYNDTLTAPGGCDSVIVTDLTIEDENAVTQDVSICWGGSYIIGASEYTVTGTYTDVITSSTFCDSIITTNLTVELPVNIAVSQDENVLTAAASGATYQWMNCDTGTEIPGATNQVYATFSIGSYAVIVTQNGCTDTSACVYVATIGINENQHDNFNVYPNPATDLISLAFEFEGSKSIQLFDQLGKLVYNDDSFESNVTIDVSNLERGMYQLIIRNQEGVYTRKLLLR